MFSLKMILPALALAGLGGCAVYPEPGYGGYSDGPYVSEPPVTVYGGTSITYGSTYGYPVPVPVYPRRYHEARPPPPRPFFHGGGYHCPPEAHRPPSGHRPDAGPRPTNPSRREMLNRHNPDRDGDGVPDRVDRDRDGDGARNRFDRRPDHPRQR